MGAPVRMLAYVPHPPALLLASILGPTSQTLAFLPPLPSLRGLQLEGCLLITAAAAKALRAVSHVEYLLLLNAPSLDDAFLVEAVAHLPAVQKLVLAELPYLHDEGLQVGA